MDWKKRLKGEPAKPINHSDDLFGIPPFKDLEEGKLRGLCFWVSDDSIDAEFKKLESQPLLEYEFKASSTD